MKRSLVVSLLVLVGLSSTGCVVVGRGTKVNANCDSRQAVEVDGTIYLVNVYSGRVQKLDPATVKNAPLHTPEDVEVDVDVDVD